MLTTLVINHLGQFTCKRIGLFWFGKDIKRVHEERERMGLEPKFQGYILTSNLDFDLDTDVTRSRRPGWHRAAGVDQAHNVQWRPWYPGCLHGQEESTPGRYPLDFAVLWVLSCITYAYCTCTWKITHSKWLGLDVTFSCYRRYGHFVADAVYGLCLVQVPGWWKWVGQCTELE